MTWQEETFNTEICGLSVWQVRERLVQEATVLLQRLRGHTSCGSTDDPCPSQPCGLAVLKGCSLEHCVALSGELDLYSHVRPYDHIPRTHTRPCF